MSFDYYKIKSGISTNNIARIITNIQKFDNSLLNNLKVKEEITEELENIWSCMIMKTQHIKYLWDVNSSSSTQRKNYDFKYLLEKERSTINDLENLEKGQQSINKLKTGKKGNKTKSKKTIKQKANNKQNTKGRSLFSDQQISQLPSQTELKVGGGV